MEMSIEYMQETAEAMKNAGFTLVEDENRYGESGPVGRLFRLKRGHQASFVLEALPTVDGRTQFYLAIESYHGLQSPSFPLDSWKHHKDRFEFKYLADLSTGRGLSFVIHQIDNC